MNQAEIREQTREAKWLFMTPIKYGLRKLTQSQFLLDGAHPVDIDGFARALGALRIGLGLGARLILPT